MAGFALRGRGAAVPPTVYPPGVVASGVQHVWDLDVGVKEPLLYNPVANAGLLPSGTVIDGDNIHFPAQPFTLANWDFNGFAVWMRYTANVGTFSHCRFSGTPALLLSLGDEGSPTHASYQPNVTYDDCTFDATTCEDFYDSVVMKFGGTAVFNRTKFRNAPRNFIANTQGVLRLYQSTMRELAQRPNPAAHFEFINGFGGEVYITESLLDGRAGHDGGNGTGIISPNTEFEATTWEVNESILIGAPELDLLWNIQLGDVSRPNFSSLELNNSVLDSGSAGFISAGPNSVAFGVGNHELYTGAVYTPPA